MAEVQESSWHAHHLFISYARQPDRPLAKRIESFLEGFHRTIRIADPEAPESQANSTPEPLRICLDGSDLVLTEHLAQCRELLVLCSERAVASLFVQREVNWFGCGSFARQCDSLEKWIEGNEMAG